MIASLLVAPEEAESWFTALAPHLTKIGINLHRGAHPHANIAIVANPVVGQLRALPELRLIASLWAGVDRLLADESIPDTVAILRACDSEMRQSMTESALAHILCAHLKLHYYRLQQSKALWQQHKAQLAQERQITILGMGYLGSHVAMATQQLGFQVSGWSRSARRPDRLPDSVALYQGIAQLHDALSNTDILVNLLPGTAETRHLLNKSLFMQCKKGVCLINLARGTHVVEQDLLECLDSEHVAHATLDVFYAEPLPSEHPFWQHPSITITPHIAAPSHFESVANSVCSDIAIWLGGATPASIVNRKNGY
jgi:glyoxylate/hydroxypyruvate reductase